MVLHDPQHLQRQCPRMMSLLARYAHAIQINRTHEEIRELQDAFLVLDSLHYVRRPVAHLLPRRDRPRRRERGARDARPLQRDLGGLLPCRLQHYRRTVNYCETMVFRGRNVILGCHRMTAPPQSHTKGIAMTQSLADRRRGGIRPVGLRSTTPLRKASCAPSLALLAPPPAATTPPASSAALGLAPSPAARLGLRQRVELRPRFGQQHAAPPKPRRTRRSNPPFLGQAPVPGHR